MSATSTNASTASESDNRDIEAPDLIEAALNPTKDAERPSGRRPLHRHATIRPVQPCLVACLREHTYGT